MNADEEFSARSRKDTRGFRKEPNLFAAILFSALETAFAVTKIFPDTCDGVLGFAAKYIRGRMRDGEFRTTNPLTGRAKLYRHDRDYNIMHNLLDRENILNSADRTVSRTLAEIWLNGMLARNNSGRAAESK